MSYPSVVAVKVPIMGPSNIPNPFATQSPHEEGPTMTTIFESVVQATFFAEDCVWFHVYEYRGSNVEEPDQQQQEAMDERAQFLEQLKEQRARKREEYNQKHRGHAPQEQEGLTVAPEQQGPVGSSSTLLMDGMSGDDGQDAATFKPIKRDGPTLLQAQQELLTKNAPQHMMDPDATAAIRVEQQEASEEEMRMARLAALQAEYEDFQRREEAERAKPARRPQIQTASNPEFGTLAISIPMPSSSNNGRPHICTSTLISEMLETAETDEAQKAVQQQKGLSGGAAAATTMMDATAMLYMADGGSGAGSPQSVFASGLSGRLAKRFNTKPTSLSTEESTDRLPALPYPYVFYVSCGVSGPQSAALLGGGTVNGAMPALDGPAAAFGVSVFKACCALINKHHAFTSKQRH